MRQKIRIATATLSEYSQRWLFYVLSVLLVAYFIFHAVYGDRGAIALWQLKGEIAQSEAELAGLQKDVSVTETKTRGLYPETLDLDLLEEESRKAFGYARPEEQVILLPGQH